MIAFERIVDAFRAEGLNVKDNGHGKASAQAPGHSGADLSVTITDIGGQVLIHSHSDPTADVLDKLNLTTADLFDNPKGAEYRYSDGRTVYRTPDKKFRQSGNTKGRALFNVESVKPGGTVFVTEGEKCALAIKSAGGIAVSPAMGAGKASQFDWTPLRDCAVTVVADKDKPGRAHAADVRDILSAVAKSVDIVEAKSGKDAADHIAAGYGLDELVPVEMDEAPTSRRRLKVTRGTEVKTKRVLWVMPDWLPCGSLTLLAGREGLGKSTIACAIAAAITNGTLPGVLHGKPSNILYVHSEDSREFTVAPRLRAAGADMDRVFFVDVQTETTDSGTVVLPLDNQAIEKVIAEHDIAFMCLDAATSSMSAELSGKDDRAVRQFLEPLSQLAARRDCVVLGLCHFGKRDGADTGKLILGSIAWSQVARSVLSVALDEESGHLVVTNTKGNLAPRIRSMEAEIVSTTVDTDDGDTEVGVLQWRGESSRDARDLLEGPSDESAERDEATVVIRDYLQGHGGQAPASDVLKAARAAGLNDTAVKKARRRAGVATRKIGVPGKPGYWVWTLEDSLEDSEDSHSRERESSESSVESSDTPQRNWSLPQSGNDSRATPSHGPTGPTGPTGPDPHKHNGPTAADSQSGQLGNDVHNPSRNTAFTPPTGPDRCPECGYHEPTQGHRADCRMAA